MTATPRTPAVVAGWGKWIVVSWIVILVVFVLTPNVLQFPYPTNAEQPRNLHNTIRVFLVLIPLGTLVSASVRDRFVVSPPSFFARVTFFAAVFFIGILHGSRGAMTGLLIAVTAMDLVYCKATRPVKVTILVADVLCILFVAVNWGPIRVLASDIGFWPAFFDSFDQYRQLFETNSLKFGEVYVGDVPMLGQSMFHFLYVVALIDSGVSLDYQTFINLVPQQLPEVLETWFYERPLNDNWILGDYYAHGGGFYSYANAYWNGGVVPMMLFAAALAWCIARIELLFKGKDYVFAMAYFSFAFLLPVNMYYGIQGLVRGLEYGLIAYLLTSWLARKYVRR